jgi:hypothetical protein
MFLITEYATDETYGRTIENPIMVGGVSTSEGPTNQHRFLIALAGPNGEEITYVRIGSCCSFYTKNQRPGSNSENAIGFLDRYSINYKGLSKPIVLYINMYDSDVLKVPVGFTLRK